MPETPIDQSAGIQSIRLKVPTGTVPIPPGGYVQLHSPSPGTLALRMPDGSVVAVGAPAWLQSGEGPPVDTVTPVRQGATYQDLANGGWYVAVGPTANDWIAFGGVDGNIGTVTGIVWNLKADPPAVPFRNLWVMGGERDTPTVAGAAYFGDAWSMWNGSGQGLVWGGNGASPDPEASLSVKTGANGQHVGVLQDANGDMSVPGTVTATNGVILPTSDPHIVGALWNNAGTPAISTG